MQQQNMELRSSEHVEYTAEPQLSRAPHAGRASPAARPRPRGPLPCAVAGVAVARRRTESVRLVAVCGCSGRCQLPANAFYADAVFDQVLPSLCAAAIGGRVWLVVDLERLLWPV